MATIHVPHRHRTDPTTTDPTTKAAGSGGPMIISEAAAKALALLRITFGLTFLWAFFDKLLALGYATGRDDAGNVDRFGNAAWIHGGSPTEGFLKFGADGPFADFYRSIAGAAWVDWAFMLALLGIGVALTFGIGMRLAGFGGAVLYLMMWSVALPPANNPVLDEHVLGAISLVALTLANAGTVWGLGKRWASSTLVAKVPLLR
ncbi:hypothetical protein [Marmoricola sp. RAF53]|uniref:hypothetical protein n=1 Tax=Marmoricola sp. RAF53 TaxID=3233059 RepID=UPI003F97D5DB